MTKKNIYYFYTENKNKLELFFFRNKMIKSSSKNCGQGGKYKTQQNTQFIAPKKGKCLLIDESRL